MTIKLVTFDNNMPYGVLSFSFKNGSKVEDANTSGLVHLLEHLMFRDSSDGQVEENLKLLGDLSCSYNAYTCHSHTNFYTNFLYKDFEKVLRSFSKIVLDSSFQEDDFSSERKIVIREYNDYKSSPDFKALDCFVKKTYGELFFNTIGDLKVLENSTYEQLSSLRDRVFCIDNLIISIAGNREFFKNNDLHSILEKNMNSNLKIDSEIVVQQDSFGLKSGYEEEDLGNPSTRLFISKKLENKFFFPVNFLTYMLDSNMDSPMFKKLREERGSCYSFSYDCDFMTDRSFNLVFLSEVDSGLVNEVIEDYFKLVRDFYNNESLFRSSKERLYNKYSWDKFKGTSVIQNYLDTLYTGINQDDVKRILTMDFDYFKKSIKESGILDKEANYILKCF